MKKALVVITLLLVSVVEAGARDNSHTLLQKPTVSETQIAFVYAGDIWVVGRQGGEARRLTTGVGIETDPVFAPDGSWIAFTGQYDGNIDVYVVAASGGVPTRLTYHPGPDFVVGWSRDGKEVLFRSPRKSYSGFTRLFSMPVTGGFPSEIPLPMAFQGSYSPDSASIAYMPLAPAFAVWKRYRGGRATPIWIARLSDSNIEKLPREDSNDFSPMWVDGRIYFLSDRNGPVTLFYYDLGTRRVTEAIRNTGGLDIKSASAGPGAIVYEQFGSVHLFDVRTGRTNKIDIRVSGDMPSVRPRYERVANRISSYSLSPTGVRVAFQARGEIVTVPAEKGDPRNLTNTPGVAERDPAWSPDGRWIAYFSDDSGEYELHLRDQRGMGEVRKFNLGTPPSFFYSPTWSPDSKKIAYTDKRLNLWYIDLEKGSPVKVDTNTFDNPFRVLDPSWSPDSRWIAYTKQLRNRLGAVFVYSLETGTSNQITDGLSDSRFASFDKNGKFLYFTASTNAGPASGWLDMSSFSHSVTRNVYVVVLGKDTQSPLAFESDEEKVSESEKNQNPQQRPAAPAERSEASQTVSIDFENIDQRILALPIPAGSYTGMFAGKTGILFILEGASGFPGGPTSTLHRFDLSKRRAERVIDGIRAFELSFNGEKMLLAQGNRWFIAPAAQPIRPGEGTVNVSQMEVFVDPRAEWNQIFREAWRIQRDFFYDPGLHGLDLQAAARKYEPYLAGVAHRADLTYLMQEMLGNMSVGHHNVGGGDQPQVSPVPGGLLGADYETVNGRYRLARIYNGENWNPGLQAPLTQPGVNVRQGEYLLAVNGREVRAGDNVYSFFENTAGKAVVLKVGPTPDGEGSREVTVVPVNNEQGLRSLAWIEGNRRKVDELSGGKLAYVYLPNTAGAGYVNFNRYYFAQIDRQGAVIDERFNGGGTAADYIVDYMRRPLMNYWATREGEDFTTPVGSIYGPKAMIVNEYAGSGGDALPWYFRKAGIGKLIGKRTWGGLVGIYDYPQLIDGGGVTAPRVAFYNLDGEWEVENFGVAPDIEVEFDPREWRNGRDPQLEKTVEVLLDELKRNPLPTHRRPAYPNFHKPAPGAASSR